MIIIVQYSWTDSYANDVALKITHAYAVNVQLLDINQSSRSQNTHD